jgi:hypothetical protein
MTGEKSVIRFLIIGVKAKWRETTMIGPMEQSMEQSLIDLTVARKGFGGVTVFMIRIRRIQAGRARKI